MQSEQDNRAIQEELRKLRQELDTTKKQVADLNVNQLRYPVDANSQSVFNALFDTRLKNTIMDTTWKRIFRWYEPFDSVDNWDLTANAGVFGGVIYIASDTAPANPSDLDEAAARLNLNNNIVSPFNYDSYVRFAFFLKGDSPTTDSQYYLTVGDHLAPRPPATTKRKFYGFKIVNDSLYGVISNAGRSDEILTPRLLTLAPFDDTLESYFVEARYYAGVKIDFFAVKNVATGKGSSNLGTSNEAVYLQTPSNPIASLRSPIQIPVALPFDTPFTFSFSATTRDTGQLKEIDVFDTDYIQSLNIS